ncbi:MAG TPA: ASKHA domain-containing protein, partial [Victivallales bacterium]|nr:ASKHA domain-containing protein [Victivallales bacterium]
MKNFKISFPAYKKELQALEGSSLFECIARAGILIKNPCAGQGICGKCKIRIISGKSEPAPECREFFSSDEISAGWRLACRVKIFDNIEVEIPPETSFENELLVLTQDDNPIKMELDPFVKKKEFEISPPSLENNKADFQGLRESLDISEADIELLRKIPQFLRENNFKGTAAICGKRLVSIEAGSESANFAIAVDLGTTSIVASLIDVNTGRVVDSKGTLNPQVRFGDDVLSRIMSHKSDRENLLKLQRDAIKAFNELVSKLCAGNGISQDKIYSAAIAGNTAMECFFCGVSAEYLGEIPFVPPFKKSLVFKASDFGMRINPSSPVYIFPLIGGFVGGDIVSGISACRLDEKQKPTLFIDIGTNGEIVVAAGGKLYAASAAAGPAFEGARIECGMRAAPGAIEKVVFSEDGVNMNIIKSKHPSGICGSAIIDVVAELLKWGILEESGRMKSPDELPADCPKALRDKLFSDDGGCSWDFMLTSDAGKKIFIRQKDVRE